MPIRLTGTANSRDQRRAQAAEEQKDDDHHEDEGLDQRLLHLVDRVGDEDGRIVGDFPGQIVRETLLQLGHHLAARR